MNEKSPSGPSPDHRDEITSALFAHMVIQQSNMAMMLLGKVPHPQSGQTVRDLEAAKLFIDQLEMLEIKTRGNLNKEEEHLLKQTLMALRMAFVDTVEPERPAAEHKSETPAPAPAGEPAQPEAESQGAVAAEEDRKKKFSKKY